MMRTRTRMPPLHIQPKRAVALLAAVTVFLIAASAALLVWEMRKRELERARLDTASLAHMFREQTERNFESADQVLRGVQERMRSYGAQPLDSPVVRLLLGSRIIGAPNLEIVAITDATGRVMNSSRDDPQMVDSIADTAYFKAFASGTADGLIIDKPVHVGPGAWTLDLARAFTDAQGRFLGVVVLTMKVPALEQIYSWPHLDYERPIALYRSDGILMASVPPRDNFIGDRPPELNPWPVPIEDTQLRTVTHTAGDGTQQVFVVARVGAFPLLATVTSDDEPALASWRESAFSIGFGALLMCLLTVVAAVVLTRKLERVGRLTGALRDANERYQSTVESLTDAIVSVDEQQNITLFNTAAERMFGLPAREALGGPVSRFIPERAREAHARHLAGFIQAEAPGSVEMNRDVTGLRADGTEFPIESALTRTTDGGRRGIVLVLRDMTERRRAERELRETNRQLRALSASLQDVREQERTRIAAELHDELGQQLTGLKLELSWCASRLKEGRPPTPEHMDAMRHQLDSTIVSVRRIATELRPRMLDDLGFGEAIAWQVSEFARRSGLSVQMDLAASDCVTDRAVATALFRIVQESLTNIARHAGATKVTVQLWLEPTDQVLLLRVQDDGHGFDTSPPEGGGIGLVSMRERAMALGGVLRVASALNRGTTIDVALPLYAPALEEIT